VTEGVVSENIKNTLENQKEIKMTVDEMIDFAEENNEEYIKFEKVENKLHNRPDVNAFLLLDKLIPGNRPIIIGAGYDEYWLEPDLEELAKVITKENILDLIRCGVRFDAEGLAMFA
jgi:hypothetical protein